MKKLVGTMKKPACIEYLDKASDFYRHHRWGLEALPQFADDDPEGLHFGMPVKWTSVGPDPDVLIPVTAWGAHILPVPC